MKKTFRPFRVGVIRGVLKKLTKWDKDNKTTLAWCTDGWKLIPVKLPEKMDYDQADKFCVGKNFLEV